MKLPNLIIAGVPKAGTSSLFRWLASHPEVYGLPCIKKYRIILYLKSLYLKSNINKTQSASFYSESLARLDEYFQPHNQKLADEFNLNLDFWR